MASGAFCVHPALEDEDGGHLVYDLAAAFDGHIGFAEEAVGLGGAEAFVPEMDWQLETLAQFLGEALHFFCLDAFGSTHAERVADDELGYLVLADYSFQLGEVEAFVLAVQGFDSLGSDTQKIRDGEANPLGADIEAEDAGVMGRVGWL